MGGLTCVNLRLRSGGKLRRMLTARDLMTTEVATVAPGATVPEAARLRADLVRQLARLSRTSA